MSRMPRVPRRRPQEPLDHAELDRLLPAPGDPALSDGRRRLLEEHLMREIQPAPETTPAPRPRPVRRALFIGAPLTALALAGALLTGVIGGGATAPAGSDLAGGPVVQLDAGSTEKVASAISRISAAAARQKTPEPRADQYLYVRSLVSFQVTELGHGDDVTTHVPPARPREVWKSPDGTKGFLVDESKLKGNGEFDLADPNATPHVGSPTYDFLRTLPTDSDALLKKIYRDTKGQGRGADQQAFVTIGDLLREEYAPAELSAALYRAAAKIPGVVLVERAEDAAGREGVAVAREDEADGVRTEWIFDRSSYAYLGERVVRITDGKARNGMKAGTVVGHTAVLERAVVDAPRERPDDGDGAGAGVGEKTEKSADEAEKSEDGARRG